MEKRKKGKLVTVARGLSAEENELPALLGKLKAACGAGGTVKDDLLPVTGRGIRQRDRGVGAVAMFCCLSSAGL